jgi:hypothetical protein
MRVLFAAVCFWLGWAAVGSAQQEVHLIGSVAPKLDDSVRVEVVTTERSHSCLTYRAPKGVLCVASLTSGAASVRIEIRARGYKVFTLNVPQIVATTGGIGEVRFGAVSLVKTELPVVERVVQGQAESGSRVFELTLKNTLARDVLIRALKVEAERRGAPLACCCPPTAVYELGDTITVNGGSAGEINVGGAYREVVKGRDFAVATTGRITRSLCNGGMTLSLSLPVSFVIPKASFSAIQVRIPETIAVRDSSYCCGTAAPTEKPGISADTSSLGQFDRFAFTLSTEEQDELDIVAAYPMDAGASGRRNRD